ncbi:hypothetical protein HHI36_013226, partial [Cryptolaemus montrouzieri]
ADKLEIYGYEQISHSYAVCGSKAYDILCNLSDIQESLLQFSICPQFLVFGTQVLIEPDIVSAGVHSVPGVHSENESSKYIIEKFWQFASTNFSVNGNGKRNPYKVFA